MQQDWRIRGGYNLYGQLGTGNTTSYSVPTSVNSAISWAAIAADQMGIFSLGINGANGLAYAWGNNSQGQLGDNSTTDRSVPTSVSSAISFLQISASYRASLAFQSAQATIVASSETTIKTEGFYALKVVASTNAINSITPLKISRTLTGEALVDLRSVDTIQFDIYSSRTGSNIKLGITDSGGTLTEITPNILSANTWQTVSWDISAVANTNKDVINTITVTMVDASVENTFYIDNFKITLAVTNNVFGWVA